MKLADFGVAAKLAEMEDGGAALRSSVVGTPYWMAPEVILMPNTHEWVAITLMVGPAIKSSAAVTGQQACICHEQQHEL